MSLLRISRVHNSYREIISYHLSTSLYVTPLPVLVLHSPSYYTYHTTLNACKKTTLTPLSFIFCLLSFVFFAQNKKKDKKKYAHTQKKRTKKTSSSFQNLRSYVSLSLSSFDRRAGCVRCTRLLRLRRTAARVFLRRRRPRRRKRRRRRGTRWCFPSVRTASTRRRERRDDDENDVETTTTKKARRRRAPVL